RQLLEDLGDLLVGQPLEEDRHLARLELWHEIRPVALPDAFGKSPYAVALALTDEALDLAEQLGRRFAGHGVAPNTWGVTGWTGGAPLGDGPRAEGSRSREGGRRRKDPRA